MSDGLDWEILSKDASEMHELSNFAGDRYNSWQRNWDSLPDSHKDAFTHPVWLISWFRVLSKDDAQLFLLRRNGKVVTGVPFRIIPRLAIPGFCCALVHDDDYLIAGASISGDPQIIEAGFRLLFQSGVPGYRHALGIRLGKVDSTHALISSEFAQAQRLGARSILDVREGLDSLLSGVSKNFKGNLRKSRNRLNKLEDVSMKSFTNADSIEEGLDRLIAMEAHSWKGREASTVGDSPKFQNFLLNALKQLAKREEAFVQSLSIGKQDIAAQLCLRFGETLHVFKIGYDDSQKTLSPGNMLLERSIKESCPTLGVNIVSLVSRQTWHDKWKPELRGTYSLQWFPLGLAGLVGRLTEVTPRERLKRVLIKLGLRKTPVPLV